MRIFLQNKSSPGLPAKSLRSLPGSSTPGFTSVRRRIVFSFVFISLVVIIESCKKEAVSAAFSPELTLDLNDSSSGGLTTNYIGTSNAFGTPLNNISDANLVIHRQGDAVFNANFVAPPSQTNPGLGPLFNNISCSSCHNKDGRGQPPIDGQSFNAFLFRVSIPGTDAHGGPLAVPGFGLQMQNRAVYGTTPEGEIGISYAEVRGKFADGTAYSLRNPTYFVKSSYLPMPGELQISPRIAAPNFGLGLLDAVPEQEILELAAAEKLKSNGVAGIPNYTWDDQLQQLVFSRYGWKANQSSILQQCAAALNQDMGITSSYYAAESSAGQSQAVPAHDAEISDSDLDALSLYIKTLGPPGRRNASSSGVKQGYSLFIKSGCTDCHAAELTTESLAGVPEVGGQKIHPFTDLLLHDMGPGLADGRPDYAADGSHWRTAPLWGIGLTQTVNGHTFFLHDGRARNLTEAILWHGGEASNSKQVFLAMSITDRTSLLGFLTNL